MPIYEYECRKCKHRFERIQQIADPQVRKCPKCRTGRVGKLVSSPAVHFKGTGWYVTDYAPKESADEAGKRAADQPGKGAKDETGKGGKDSKGKDATESKRKDARESDGKTSEKKSPAKSDSTKKSGK